MSQSQAMKLSDQAWAQIVNAHGNVQGKAFHLSGQTLMALRRERGLNRSQVGRLYSVALVVDDSIPFGTIRLTPRATFRWEN